MPRNYQRPKCEVVDETKFTTEISCLTHTWLVHNIANFAWFKESFVNRRTRQKFLLKLVNTCVSMGGSRKVRQRRRVVNVLLRIGN